MYRVDRDRTGTKIGTKTVTGRTVRDRTGMGQDRNERRQKQGQDSKG